MRYEEVKAVLKNHLSENPEGQTWSQIKEQLNLPYETLCPEWTKQLETDIQLLRKPGAGRAYVWTLQKDAPDA